MFKKCIPLFVVPLLFVGVTLVDFESSAQFGSDQSGTDEVKLKGGRTIKYTGYTKDFIKIKKKMLAGDFEGASKYFEKKEKKVRKKAKGDKLKFYQKMGFLDLVERGTLDLSRGEFDGSIDAFEGAEQVLRIRNTESKAKEKSKAFFGGLLTSVGINEAAPYYGEAFEQILMLNGKAVAYLLKGDRLAYNVTRRSIDWQNTQKVAFDAEQQKIQRDLEEKKSSGTNPFYDVIERVVWDSYKDLETKAQEVPSAFVNPFGYYLAGMIQEFESVEDPSLMDNARISYSKALELSPKSTVIQQAYQAMKDGEKAGGRRLVHIISFDGFTPEKKMMQFKLPLPGGMIIPIKLPIYQPVSTLVSRTDVTREGKAVADLDQIASVEAISLRYQSDQRPKQTLDVLIAVGISVGKRIAAQGNGFALAAIELSDMKIAPDMRSWMSLPKTISAARFYATDGMTSIELNTYDVDGNVLSTKTVGIAESGPTFVFVRSMDKQLQAYANQGLWLN